jgi:uncharacterized protein (DUF302 family)
MYGKQLGAQLWGAYGDQDAKFLKVTEDMQKIGFVISDPHPRINDAYAHKYGSTTLDNLGFYSSAHDKNMKELLELYPEYGGFTPFNLHIYKWKNENITWVGHLRPEIMSDIVGVTDPVAREKFASVFPALDDLIIKGIGATRVKNLYFDALPEKRMMKFEMEIDLAEYDDDLETFIEEFQETFEEAFEDAGYLIAGYKDIKETYDDMDMDFKYPAYWVYSLCHFAFSNAIFNTTPEAGIFAPCSVYMYIDEDEKKIHVGMPMLANWIAVANITDPKHVELINNLDKEIISVFKSIGLKEVE